MSTVLQHAKQRNWKFSNNYTHNDRRNMTPKRGWPFWGAAGAALAPQRFLNPKKYGQSATKIIQGLDIASKQTPMVQNESQETS